MTTTTENVLTALSGRIDAMAGLLGTDTEAVDYKDKMMVRGLWVLDQFLFDTNTREVCPRAYPGLARVIAIEYRLAEYGLTFLDVDPDGAVVTIDQAISRIKVGSTEVSYSDKEGSSGGSGSQSGILRDLAIEASDLYRRLVHGCRKFPKPSGGDLYEPDRL